MPKPNITSSTPSLFTSTLLMEDSEISFGILTVHTSVTFKSLQGKIFVVIFSLVFATIQFFILSIGRGNIDTKITTIIIRPATGNYIYFNPSALYLNYLIIQLKHQLRNSKVYTEPYKEASLLVLKSDLFCRFFDVEPSMVFLILYLRQTKRNEYIF